MQDSNIIQLNADGEIQVQDGQTAVAESVDIKIGTIGENVALQFNIPVMLVQLPPQLAADFADALKAHAESVIAAQAADETQQH